MQEDADLPKPLPHGKLEVHLVVSRFVPGGRSPVSFSKFRYRHDSIGACSISGVVSNRFTERKQNLQLRIAGFTARRLATGDFTYVDKVFPRIDATFEVDMFGSALCPRRLNRIRVLPNLSEDKIFNP